ncbi:fatty acid desaturase [Candidatus Bandiella numerosa]|uniref:acyl-CoA desaturase n=1 Tax=Candidatus Bandiella numerosa TaxID=2570586 RepID=UPI00249F7AA0|nr:fatty acid desaturase [Candidatus Bandiella numerosa]WHA05142.1 fatty acid desaturase [Candidatus Bandiella numerosa]
MNDKSKLVINYPALFVIVVYPIVLSIIAMLYGYKYGIGKFEIISIIATYYIVNISVGVGLHRLWSHTAFKTKKWVEIILACLTAGTLQGPILAWASDHMLHHKYTDKESDPHSALKYKNKFIGFMWSHIGWMIFSDVKHKKIDKMALAKLGRNKVVLWQFRHYWKIAIFMNTILPMVIGYLIGGNLRYALGAFIFIGIGRAIQQQATFCVNSVVHMNIGSKEYYYGTARDIWWLFFLLLGENWHNFHHAFANDYRNGHKWYHLDIHKWVIALMAKVGLASDLIVTSKLRVESIKEQVRKKTIDSLQEKVDLIEKASRYIHEVAITKLKVAEKSALKLANDIHENLDNVIIKAKGIIKFAQDLRLKDNIEENLIIALSFKYNELKKAAQKLEIQVAPF